MLTIIIKYLSTNKIYLFIGRYLFWIQYLWVYTGVLIKLLHNVPRLTNNFIFNNLKYYINFVIVLSIVISPYL